MSPEESNRRRVAEKLCAELNEFIPGSCTTRFDDEGLLAPRVLLEPSKINTVIIAGQLEIISRYTPADMDSLAPAPAIVASIDAHGRPYLYIAIY